MSATPEPMSEEQLALIQGSFARYREADWGMYCRAIVVNYCQDVGALLAEVRRQRAELERLKSPLVTREGDSVKSFEQVIVERDKATALNSRLMDGLAQIHDYAGMSHGADWTRYYELAERTIGAIGDEEIALLKARRAVVEAAKEFAKHCFIGAPVMPSPDRPAPLFDAGNALKAVVEALEKLEAPPC